MTNDTARAAFIAHIKQTLGIDIWYHERDSFGAFQKEWRGYQASRAESDAIVDGLVEAARALERHMNRDAKASMENPTYEEAMEQIQAAEEYRKGRILTAADNTEATPPAINEER